MFKIGQIIEVGDLEYKVSSNLLKFENTYAAYADALDEEKAPALTVSKYEKKIASILRNKKILKDMKLEKEERKVMYCHELGHIFGDEKIISSRNGRTIEEEVMCDTYAVEKLKNKPEILENALRKTYEYEISKINGSTDKNRINRYIEEMTARKRNVEKLKEKISRKIKLRCNKIRRINGTACT